MVLRGLIKIFKDLLFPKNCLSCGWEGDWVCHECFEKIGQKIILFCPRCYKENEEGRVCANCRSFSFLDGVLALGDYKDVIIAKAVQSLKYDYVEEITEFFGKLLPKEEKKISRIVYGSVFMPVPLHRKRFLERGFNQAELIARAWSRILLAPVETDILIRRRFTTPQVKLKAAERRQNLRGAFVVKKKPVVEKVILVDDVFTTGSTLQECARVLKESGVKEVWGMTVAREK